MQYPWGYALPVSHILSTREHMQYPWVISSAPVSKFIWMKNEWNFTHGYCISSQVLHILTSAVVNVHLKRLAIRDLSRLLVHLCFETAHQTISWFKKYLYLSHLIQFFTLSTEVNNYLHFIYGKTTPDSLCLCIYSLNVRCVYVWRLIIITIISWRTLLKYGQIKRHS